MVTGRSPASAARTGSISAMASARCTLVVGRPSVSSFTMPPERFMLGRKSLEERHVRFERRTVREGLEPWHRRGGVGPARPACGVLSDLRSARMDGIHLQPHHLAGARTGEALPHQSFWPVVQRSYSL